MTYYVFWSSFDESGVKEFEDLSSVKEELKFEDNFYSVYDVIEGNSIMDKFKKEGER